MFRCALDDEQRIIDEFLHKMAKPHSCTPVKSVRPATASRCIRAQAHTAQAHTARGPVAPDACSTTTGAERL
eukprot:CAMPEP_0119359580 /NCGR_PEP_ID=MMETSP1334-20130426/7442_1 /TAXON_ID=127549 /ORGANISM="Calcidiscus leptoporus, Strain RCC1130" /LENGTH=71 /DNA_ID=CAMNT_0007374281 /DNA_START=63 /DNA_END=275 /DNA_ORIENTATION=+